MRYQRFKDFYPYYLSEHRHPTCRNLHYLGSCLSLVMLFLALFTGSAWFLLAGLLCGYGCAWVGHFVFEKNRPATFKYPIYSFCGDWLMFWQHLKGLLPGRRQH